MFHPRHITRHSVTRVRAAALTAATLAALATGPALADGDAAKGEKMFCGTKLHMLTEFVLPRLG